MKTKKYAILTAALVIVLCAVLMIGATFALFGDRKTNSVTITAGSLSATADFVITDAASMDVKAEDFADDGVAVTDGGTGATFALGGTAAVTQAESGFALTMSDIAPGDIVTVALNIENTGDMAIRYQIAMTEDDSAFGEFLVCKTSGVALDTLSDPLAADGTATLTISVGLSEEAGNELMGQNGSVTFVIDIVQGNATEIPGEDVGA